MDELARFCRDPNPASAAACEAEVSSLAQIMATLGKYATEDRAGYGLCPSGDPRFDPAAATQAFLAWAQAHPDQGPSAAGGGVRGIAGKMALSRGAEPKRRALDCPVPKQVKARQLIEKAGFSGGGRCRTRTGDPRVARTVPNLPRRNGSEA